MVTPNDLHGLRPRLAPEEFNVPATRRRHRHMRSRHPRPSHLGGEPPNEGWLQLAGGAGVPRALH
eukprot:2311125-Lingulodinium_polyedra.AAC.1